MEDETASQAAISAWMTNFSLRMTSADPGHVRRTRNVETHTVPEQIGDPFGLWGGEARKEFVEHSLYRHWSFPHLVMDGSQAVATRAAQAGWLAISVHLNARK